MTGTALLNILFKSFLLNTSLKSEVITPKHTTVKTQKYTTTIPDAHRPFGFHRSGLRAASATHNHPVYALKI